MGDVEEEGDLEKNDTVSFNKSASQRQGFYQNTITETTVTLTPTIAMSMAISSTTELSKQPSDHPSSHHHYHNLISCSRHSLKQLLKPCTVVIILSFAISLVDPVKALFTTQPPSSVGHASRSAWYASEAPLLTWACSWEGFSLKAWLPHWHWGGWLSTL